MSTFINICQTFGVMGALWFLLVWWAFDGDEMTNTEKGVAGIGVLVSVVAFGFALAGWMWT